MLLLALRSAPWRRRRVEFLDAAVLIGSVAAFAAALTGADVGYGIAELWKGLILLMSAVLIVRRVLARPTVTVQSIYGAISAYLIIGLMFASFYAAMRHLGPAPFFANGQPANSQTFQYFSFTTLTTLGYGDFTAASNGGRAVAVIEALAGQVFLAMLVARLVAAFRGPAEGARPADDRSRPPVPARAPPSCPIADGPRARRSGSPPGRDPARRGRRGAADSRAPGPAS